ncbi:hypothetical protein SAMN04515620_11946 [Collimonas sp. OK607]|nr:hypothetical protein SAMN04515620_11946 [Collimonas sp. OK607]
MDRNFVKSRHSVFPERLKSCVTTFAFQVVITSLRLTHWLPSLSVAYHRRLTNSRWTAVTVACSKHILFLITLYFLTNDALLLYVNTHVGIAQQHS